MPLAQIQPTFQRTIFLLFLHILCYPLTQSQSSVYSTLTGKYVMPNKTILLQANQSRSYCRAQYGTDLASIHSSYDQAEAYELCRDIIYAESVPPTDDYGCTIGLNDIDIERGIVSLGWVYFDNSTYDYQASWAQGEPNQQEGTDEDCVGLAIDNKYGGEWVDFSCYADTYWHMTFICNTPPTQAPTTDPTGETSHPSETPTETPTNPTNNPSETPSRNPSISPSDHPTTTPTTDPTLDPTKTPTHEPTTEPTIEPTVNPTLYPTHEPTHDPTMIPTVDPTINPTLLPTYNPSKSPTFHPSLNPSLFPTISPVDDGVVNDGITTTVMDRNEDKDTQNEGGLSIGLWFVIAAFGVLSLTICIGGIIWMIKCLGVTEKVQSKQVEMNNGGGGDGQAVSSVHLDDSENLYGAGNADKTAGFTQGDTLEICNNKHGEKNDLVEGEEDSLPLSDHDDSDDSQSSNEKLYVKQPSVKVTKGKNGANGGQDQVSVEKQRTEQQDVDQGDSAPVEGEANDLVINEGN